MQVPFLVNKINEESNGWEESATRRQLLKKIASLTQPQMKRAADALAMIWNCVKVPLGRPPAQPKTISSVTPTRFSDWSRVKLALLKSITTGAFIDVQFYAYNKISDNLPQDPKPLYTSSIVIEGWRSAIAKRELERCS
jgi:hypothetical protein